MDHLEPPRSRVECIGSDRTRCGYCRSRHTSHNFGAWAHKLDVRDYQAMLDAGWRRSGNYLYRPNLISTCCPSYVIRLDARKYTPSSTHKRVLKRLKKFASADVDLMHSSSSVSAASWGRDRRRDRVMLSVGVGQNDDDRWGEDEKDVVREAIENALNGGDGEEVSLEGTFDKEVVEAVRHKIKVFSQRRKKKKQNSDIKGEEGGSTRGELQLASNVALLLAAAERKLKHEADFHSGQENKEVMETVGKGKKKILKEEELERQMEIANALGSRVRESLIGICEVSVTSPGFLNFGLESDDMEGWGVVHEPVRIEKQTAVGTVGIEVGKEDFVGNGGHDREPMRTSVRISSAALSRVGSDVSAEKSPRGGDDSSLAAPELIMSSLDAHGIQKDASQRAGHILENLSEGKSFTMELVPAQFMSDAYEVFRKYQIAVHQEHPQQCNENTYKRFLVDSPLVRRQSENDPEQVYGSFHMLYRVRGRLFAVGVVDILPRCLSSVYLFYDPDYAKLSPGTLSALKEIQWIQQSAVIYPSLQFYYMGYYIHSCAKMRYKASYHPSELLCEQTRHWVPVSRAQSILDSCSERFTRLAAEDASPAPDANDFEINAEEAETLTGDARLQISVDGTGTRVVNYRTLDQLLHAKYPEQMEALQRKIRAFIGLVGKASSKFFLHVL